MDSHNPVSQTTTSMPTVPPTQQVAPQPQMPVAPSGGSNKIMLWFIIGLVIVVLAVGGIYLFLSKQPASTSSPQPSTPVVQASPSPTANANLESDLNNINVDEAGTATDFAPVDQDLQKL